jgi:chemotaxis protein CheC
VINLSEDQSDALVEIFNISIGRAASALSRIVGEKIVLAVPSLQFMQANEAAERLGLNTQRICGVTQEFSGPFSTEAILMFPEDRSLEIVRMMLGESYSMDELSELEQEAMSEIGNILLNACIGSIANLISSRFDSTMPEVRLGNGDDLLRVSVRSADDTVLLIFIDFNIAARTIQGYMAFLMDVPSINGLIESVDRFIAAPSA